MRFCPLNFELVDRALDKKEVTDRVLNTVKGFEKVDAGVVSV